MDVLPLSLSYVAVKRPELESNPTEELKKWSQAAYILYQGSHPNVWKNPDFFGTLQDFRYQKTGPTVL